MAGRQQPVATLHPQQYRLHAGLEGGVEARVLIFEMMRLRPPHMLGGKQRLAPPNFLHHPL